MIVVTANGSVPDAVKAMRLGAVDFLPKPVTPEQIRAAVDEVLARHEPAAPVTTGSAFADDLVRAKRAVNRRAFDEALVFLKQALALNPDSAERTTSTASPSNAGAGPTTPDASTRPR